MSPEIVKHPAVDAGNSTYSRSLQNDTLLAKNLSRSRSFRVVVYSFAFILLAGWCTSCLDPEYINLPTFSQAREEVLNACNETVRVPYTPGTDELEWYYELWLGEYMKVTNYSRAVLLSVVVMTRIELEEDSISWYWYVSSDWMYLPMELTLERTEDDLALSESLNKALQNGDYTPVYTVSPLAKLKAQETLTTTCNRTFQFRDCPDLRIESGRLYLSATVYGEDPRKCRGWIDLENQVVTCPEDCP